MAAGDGAIILAQDTGRAIDLLAEEARGGHTIAKHVGKSEGFLLNRVRTERVRIGLFTVGLKRAGSFPSLEAANKLVNSTIDANGALVNRVARGERASEFITKDFGSKTGIEAYARNDRAAAYIRDTYGVGVFIVHDRASPGGYRVVTAYPRNEE